MKIVHIIPTLDTGGAEKLIYDSISLYVKEGFDVDVIVLKTTDSFFLQELKKNVKVIELGKGSVYNPINIIKLGNCLKSYNLAHLHLFPVLYWGVFAKILYNLKIPIIYTEHSTNNRRRNNLVFKIIDRYVYKQLQFIGCISEATKDSLEKHLKISNLSIKTIKNGINIDSFKTKTKHRFFFSSDDFVLTQVSSFRSQKDQKTLIKSLTLLDKRVKLLLVGDGSLRNECELLVANLKLDDRVLFTGVRNDIPEILQQSDVIVLSSNVEGFGLAIVEGMAASKPVIASDVEGVKEIVENFGLLFQKGNHKELANSVEKLFNDKSLYVQISQRCFKRANDFDIRIMVAEYSHIYRNINNENIAYNY